MKQISPLLLIIVMALLSNCASKNTKMNSSASNKASGSSIQKSTALLEYEQKRRHQEEAQQDHKDQQLLLLKKRVDKERNKDLEAKMDFRAVPQNRNLNVELKPENLNKLTDVQLYQQLVTRFERNDEFGFQVRFKRMMTQFSKSPLADDSLYMAGLMEVGLKNYGTALKHFSDVEAKYPFGNRRVSALFAKGAVYKKMNFDNLAKEIFSKVIARFPGSPESLRAERELKMIRQ